MQEQQIELQIPDVGPVLNGYPARMLVSQTVSSYESNDHLREVPGFSRAASDIPSILRVLGAGAPPAGQGSHCHSLPQFKGASKLGILQFCSFTVQQLWCFGFFIGDARDLDHLLRWMIRGGPLLDIPAGSTSRICLEPTLPGCPLNPPCRKLQCFES